MKLVISKSGVKREIETPFGIAVKPDDLRELARELLRNADRMDAEGTTYGWVRCDPSHPSDCPPNTPPRPWVE